MKFLIIIKLPISGSASLLRVEDKNKKQQGGKRQSRVQKKSHRDEFRSKQKESEMSGMFLLNKPIHADTDTRWHRLVSFK